MRQSGSATDRYTPLGLFAGLGLAQLVVLVLFALRRGVDADEGFYMAAAASVMRGELPYVDFFYPQMPYLPLIEGALFRNTGPSLIAGRMVSIVPAALSCGLLAAWACRAWSARIGIAVGALFLTNALSVSILTTGKTYGLTNLLLLVSLLLCLRPGQSARAALVAGLCAGVAVGIRLPAVAVAVVLLLRCSQLRLARGVQFLCGFVVASLPWLWIAWQDPDNFWFCNVGFHSARSEWVSLDARLLQKTSVLLKWLLTPQHVVLWLVVIAGFVRAPSRTWLALVSALVLSLGYLMATPTYLQYMTQSIPFLLLVAAPGIAWLHERPRWALALAAIYVIGIGFALRPPGEGTALWRRRELWSMERVQEVTQALRQRSAPEERILSWWEGYPVLAGRPGFAGVGFWESNAARRLSASERRRHHVRDADDIRGLIERREPKLILVPDGVWSDLRELIALHYRRAERFGELRLFERREAPEF
jgi:hypothetical protein